MLFNFEKISINLKKIKKYVLSKSFDFKNRLKICLWYIIIKKYKHQPDLRIFMDFIQRRNVFLKNLIFWHFCAKNPSKYYS